MKIVQLCPYAMDRPGGVQRHVRDLSAWLTRQGHETRIVAPPQPGARAEPRDREIQLGRAWAVGAHGTGFEISAAAPWKIRAQARELRRWGADLVHLHTPWTPMLVWQMWRALRLPTVTTVHATLPDTGGTGLVDRYIRRAARHFVTHSDAVVVPSAAPLDLLDQLVPGLAPHVLPPAIDLGFWRQSREAPRAGAAVHAVFLSRLEERKGIATLLDAWPRAAQHLPQARLTIAGDGPLRDQVIAAANADPSISFADAPSDMAARTLLATADLFLAPAPYGESFGLVLVEAMAAGAVPVAAANPGFASVLTGMGEACLVEPGNARALADRIVALGESASARANLAHWAAGHCRAFDVTVAGEQYLALYNSVLSG